MEGNSYLEIIFSLKQLIQKLNIFIQDIKNINKIHHIGDETIVNSALQIIKKENKLNLPILVKIK